MSNSINIYEYLKNLCIQYKEYEHEPLFTCDQSTDFFERNNLINIGKNKNLFLRNKKGNQHYLVTLGAEKMADLKSLAQMFGEQNLSFASPERLLKYLHLTPGAVTPFGLINDTENHIKVFIDKDLMKFEKVYFHPDRNTATLEISSKDFQKFLESLGNQYLFI